MCLGAQFKWKNFLRICVRFLTIKESVLICCEDHRRTTARGCRAVSLGSTAGREWAPPHARRSLAVAGRAGQPGRIQSRPSKRFEIMPPPLSSFYPAWLSQTSPSPATSESQLPCLRYRHHAASSDHRLAAVSVPSAAESCYNAGEILPGTLGVSRIIVETPVNLFFLQRSVKSLQQAKLSRCTILDTHV